MRVIYLDQNVVVAVSECMRATKSGRGLQQQLRSEIERCASDGSAVFPYSQVHLSEAAEVADVESRSQQIRFWERASRGYRFHDASAIQSQQVEAILNKQTVRFARHLAVHSSTLRFQDELEQPDEETKEKRRKSFRELAEH